MGKEAPIHVYRQAQAGTYTRIPTNTRKNIDRAYLAHLRVCAMCYSHIAHTRVRAVRGITHNANL
jgi:hypothetical protein